MAKMIDKGVRSGKVGAISDGCEGGIKPTDKDKAIAHMRGIERNYPGYDAPINACANATLVSEEGLSYRCTNGAIGSCLCANCHEKELAGYCGGVLAGEFHDSVRRQNVSFYDVIVRLDIRAKLKENANNNEGKGEGK